MPPLHNLACIQVRGHSTGADPRSPNIQNVYFYSRSVLTNNPSKSALYAAFVTSVVTPIYPLLSVAYVMDGIDIRWFDDALDPFQTFVSSNTPGAVTGDFVPSLMNVTVRLGTGIRGRSYRGSKHYGPIGKSATLADKLSAAAITAWTTAIAGLIAPITDATPNTWSPVILSRQPPYQFKVNPTAGTFNTVTTALLDADLGRMKRRGQVA
jgi:hypothetical protein